MQIIPFKEPAAWRSQVTLSGVIYLFYFRWNALNQYWVMNIFNVDNQPVLLGVKVVVNFDLTEQFVVVDKPSGEIICQNILDQWNDIGRFDMGETTELIYYEASEL